MLKVVNFFRGYLEVKVSGLFPERFLNVCARSGVAFWRLHRTPEGDYIARVRRGRLDDLEQLAARAMCTVCVERRVGVPFFLARFRRRYAFVAGMLLCIAAVWTASTRVWEFEVVGCETLSETQVLAALEELGVGVGTPRSEIDSELIETKMLLKIDRLRWFTINTTGSRATVELRERVSAPELLDRSTPSNVVASRGGIVEKVVALEGDPLVQPGDTVQPGQLLISGVRDMYNDKLDKNYGVNLVRARGEVTARTWYVLTAEAPLAVDATTPTGEVEVRRTLVVGKKRINLFINSGISATECDKMVERKRLVLPGGLKLPVVLETATLSNRSYTRVERDAADVEAELRVTLIDRLEHAADGEVTSTEFGFERKGDLLAATLTAEVLRDIAEEVDIPGFTAKTEDSE